MNSFLDRPKFLLERWIQKGLGNQLLLMSALIVLVAVLGGFAAWLLTDAFAQLFDAIWWSFLRLTDPGYLGDDEGLVLRTISTVVTVLGYVLFMGSLIAIMTQWLSATVQRMERGLTPIAMRGHVVVLGWTNRTPEIVARLMGARGRLQRFLVGHATRRLRIVVLSERVDAERRQDLRDYLGRLWDEDVVILRSGSSLEPEDLQRLDLLRASAIVVPGSDFELSGAQATDARVVKTLLTVEGLLADHGGADRPHVVAEILDPLKVRIARSTVERGLSIVASDGVLSRVISQSLRHRFLGRVLLGILGHRDPGSLYVRGFPELAGTAPADLHPIFPTAVVIGALRSRDGVLQAHLNPPPSFRLEPSDVLVLLSDSYDDCQPSSFAPPPPPGQLAPPPPSALSDRARRILILGWSTKLDSLLEELSRSTFERFDVVTLSRMPIAERERSLARVGFDGARVGVRHVEGDIAALHDLQQVDPGSFDNVLFVASALMDNSEEADARTILGYVLLKSLLDELADPPEIMVELLDPKNARLLRSAQDLVLISPQVLSQILAHVALRPELNTVLDELFRAGGAEVDLRRADAYELAGRPVSFGEIQLHARHRGEVALGVMLGKAPVADRMQLAPPADREWTLRKGDHVIVLATYDES